jgi:GntR family transcriptional regulator
MFRDGALLPDELTIANRLGVSRGTARAAMMRLVNDGVLERRAGVGTRLRQHPVESGVRAWRSFTREMAAKGVAVQTFRASFSEVPATKAVAGGLGIASGSLVARLDRLRGWDDVPVLLSRSWFHPRLRLSAGLDYGKPLYDVIESSTGAVAERAREQFGAVCASSALASQLRVRRGDPLLYRCHIVSDTRGRPMEYAEVYYVSARFKLTMDLRRESP